MTWDPSIELASSFVALVLSALILGIWEWIGHLYKTIKALTIEIERLKNEANRR